MMPRNLFDAIKENRLDVVSEIMATGVPIDIRDEETDATALMIAAIFGHSHIEIVRWLLKKGADPEAINNEYYSAVWCANESSSGEQIKLEIIIAIAKKHNYIPPDRSYDKQTLLNLLEKILLSEVEKLDKNTEFPVYTQKFQHLKSLFYELDELYFEKKLLVAIKTNNERMLIDALMCEANIFCLDLGYRELLYKLTSREYNAAEFKGDSESDLYKYLGYLYQLVKILEKILCKYTQAEHPLIHKILSSALDHTKITLEKYNYRNNNSYRKNSAVLFLTMLAMGAKQFEKPNLEVKSAVIKDEKDNPMTLSDVATNILEATKVNPRTAAFVAIGITQGGRLIATTNYHAPRVYDLETLLDANRYKIANKRYKNLSLSLGLVEIHAETMIASLSENLGIQEILIIDQKGIKNQNCIYCASYVSSKGFSNDQHFQRINNYNLPTSDQIAAATLFLTAYPVIPQRLRYCGPINGRDINREFDTQRKIFIMLSPEDQSKIISGENLSQNIIHFIIRYYPALSPENQQEQITKMYGETAKLSHYLCRFFYRQSNNNGKLTSAKKRNSKLSLTLDTRIVKDGERSVKAHDPSSPRSTTLAKITNLWLAAGNGSERVQSYDSLKELTLTRVPRAMR